MRTSKCIPEARRHLGHYCHVHFNMAERCIDLSWVLPGKAKRVTNKVCGLRFQSAGDVNFPRPDTHLFGDLEGVEVSEGAGGNRCVIAIDGEGEVEFSLQEVGFLMP